MPACWQTSIWRHLQCEVEGSFFLSISQLQGVFSCALGVIVCCPFSRDWGFPLSLQKGPFPSARPAPLIVLSSHQPCQQPFSLASTGSLERRDCKWVMIPVCLWLSGSFLSQSAWAFQLNSSYLLCASSIPLFLPAHCQPRAKCTQVLIVLGGNFSLGSIPLVVLRTQFSRGLK